MTRESAHFKLKSTPQVGYLPDGTPMNLAGNCLNHPENIGPDPHVPGDLSRLDFMGSSPYKLREIRSKRLNAQRKRVEKAVKVLEKRRISSATGALRERCGLPARWHALEHGGQQPEPPGDLADLKVKREEVCSRQS